MGSTAYLHKFVNGREETAPFDRVIAFLSEYGTAGQGSYVNEIVFPHDTIAELATIVGDAAEGASCIAFDRPLIDDQFRYLVFEAMRRFDLSAYLDTFDLLYVLPGRSIDPPQALLSELSGGVREVAAPHQLWPSGS